MDAVYLYNLPTLHYANTLVILYHVPSFFPSFYLPDMLCDPTDLIWSKRAPFEAVTSPHPFIRRFPSCGFLGFFLAVRQVPGSVHSPRDHFIIPLGISD